MWLTRWIHKLFRDFWVFVELDTVVCNIFHEDGLQTNVVADFKLVHVQVCFSRKALCGLHIPADNEYPDQSRNKVILD